MKNETWCGYVNVDVKNLIHLIILHLDQPPLTCDTVTILEETENKENNTASCHDY